ELAELTELSPILHFSYNSYLLWSIDSFVIELGQIIARVSNGNLTVFPIILILGFFSAGLSSLLYFLGYRFWSVVIFSTGLTACLLLSFGADYLLFGNAVWFPWFILATLIAIQDKRSSLVGMIFVGVATFFLC